MAEIDLALAVGSQVQPGGELCVIEAHLSLTSFILIKVHTGAHLVQTSRDSRLETAERSHRVGDRIWVRLVKARIMYAKPGRTLERLSPKLSGQCLAKGDTGHYTNPESGWLWR